MSKPVDRQRSAVSGEERSSLPGGLECSSLPGGLALNPRTRVRPRASYITFLCLILPVSAQTLLASDSLRVFLWEGSFGFGCRIPELIPVKSI